MFRLVVTPVSYTPQDVYKRQVYKALLKRGEAGIDQICFDTGKTAFEVSGIVTAMEMKGLLSYSCGKIYIAKL